MRREDRSRFGDFCLTKEKAGTRDRAGIKVYVRGLGKLGFGKVGRSPLCPRHMVGVWNRGTPIPVLPLFYRIPSSGMCTAGGRLCQTAHPASRAPLILFPFIFIFFLAMPTACSSLRRRPDFSSLCRALSSSCPHASEAGVGVQAPAPPILVASPYPHGTDGEGAGCASFLQDLSGVLWRGRMGGSRRPRVLFWGGNVG